jgi:hypothetical protein
METNNISTYATWTAVIILILQTICKYYNIPIGENDLTIIANAILTLIIAIWSSYNPNTIQWLGNAKPTTINTQETVLNDEYESDAE